MKAMVKRLLMLPIFIIFVLTVMMLPIIFPITFVPFGIKPTKWWIENVIDRLNGYMCEIE